MAPLFGCLLLCVDCLLCILDAFMTHLLTCLLGSSAWMSSCFLCFAAFFSVLVIFYILTSFLFPWIPSWLTCFFCLLGWSAWLPSRPHGCLLGWSTWLLHWLICMNAFIAHLLVYLLCLSAWLPSWMPSWLICLDTFLTHLLGCLLGSSAWIPSRLICLDAFLAHLQDPFLAHLLECILDSSAWCCAVNSFELNFSYGIISEFK